MTPGGTRLPLIGPAAAAPAPAAAARVAIIGLGAVGGSLAMALRKAWPTSIIIGVDTHDAIESAIRLHAVDVGADDLMIAGDAEIVVLAVGAAEAARASEHLADAIAGQATVLVLAPPDAARDAARALPARFGVIAGVPSLALRAAGIAAAQAELFAGRPWPLHLVSGPAAALDQAQALVRAVGANAVIAASA